MKEKKHDGLFNIPILILSLSVSFIFVILLLYNLFQGAGESAYFEGEVKLTSLEQSLTLCTNATEAMAYIVKSDDGQIQDFENMAASIRKTSAPIRSVQLAPAGIVSYVYPEEGEVSGKINLFADPDRKEEAEKSRDSGNIMCAGPFEMKQGGFGVAIRQSVYFISGQHKKFWGFTIVTANISDILEAANFKELEKLNYNYKLTAIVNDEEVDVAERGKIDKSNAMLVTKNILDKEWKIYVQPQISAVNWFMIFLSIFLCLGLSFTLSIIFNKNKRLTRQSIMDPLTHVFNRRGFKEAFLKCAEDKKNSSILLITMDVDNFKSFNDLYGHSNGDVLLKTFASLLKDLAGHDGIVGRNGGDEFQLYFRNPTRSLIPKLKDFFNHSHKYTYEGEEFSFNVSGGCATYPDQSTDFSELYAMADTALYNAKQNSKEKFMQYSPSMVGEQRENMGFTFKDFAAGAPAGVIIYKEDDDEKILFANKTIANIFECDTIKDFMDYVDESFKNMIITEDRDWVEDEIDRQQYSPNSGNLDNLSYRIKCKNGDIKTIVDIGRKIRHEYYGDIYLVFFFEEKEYLKYSKKRI